MAKKDIVTIAGQKFPTLNIDKSVGETGRNEIGDVMLVQAILRLIWMAKLFALRGLQSGDIPEVSGVFDKNTARAIKIYQRNNAFKLLKQDGLIEPAAYENRNLKRLGRKHSYMTITLLTSDIIDASLMLGDDGDNTVGLTRRFPQLLPWLR